jgi:hypothetical protein
MTITELNHPDFALRPVEAHGDMAVAVPVVMKQIRARCT